MPAKAPQLVLTCEHASPRTPKAYANILKRSLRYSHRGYDEGARELARSLAKALGAPLFEAEVSRLVVDCNRSLGHKALHAAVLSQFSQNTREALVERYYVPFRTKTLNQIRKFHRMNRNVVHLSVHSFVRILGTKKRKVDIGILYDPNRPTERAIARTLQATLQDRLDLAVWLNAPYRGTSDGHTTALRRIFRDEIYAGIELEVCQDVWRRERNAIKRAVTASLKLG